MNVPPDLLVEVSQAVAAHQSELSVATAEGFIVLEGRFVVSAPAGPFDSFKVSVGVPFNFPEDAPIVFETEEKIPRTIDRHVFPEGGNCCLGIWEEWLLTTPDRSFEAFLTGRMHDYLLGQAYFIQRGQWPFGERSHGRLGVVESYAELLGVESDATIVVNHLRLLSMENVKGHHLCPCGSGRRLRSCHADKVRELKEKVPLAIARRMLYRVAPKKAALPVTAR